MIPISGSFEAAEEVLQDAFLKALKVWPQTGIPRNPGAWLTTVARRQAIDARRRASFTELLPPAVENIIPAVSEPALAGKEESMPDDRLRLLFTCCHPALNQDARIALTLRTLGGLTTPEIARAFLLPPLEMLPERLASVQSVIYLIFTEGYSSSTHPGLIRGDLCAEAIRLARILSRLMPEDSGNYALLALLLLQDSRRAARLGPDGELITLDHQDRTLWIHTQMAEGLALVARLPATGRYEIEARIAAQHALALTPEATDWAAIAALYGQLPSTPVVELNRAAAVAVANGPRAGLDLMDAIQGLDEYYLFHAARADLFRRLQDVENAATAYTRALALVTNPVEASYLRNRLEALREDL
jgi:RNA polymerase sigma-70 factor (ECF subfamily)